MSVKSILKLKWILILTCWFLVPPAWGAVKALNDDISELELETEVEDQELFDQYSMAQEEQKLDQSLKGEKRALEGRIQRLNKEKSQAQKRHDKLAIRRKSSEKAYNSIAQKASEVEKVRNLEVGKTEKLQSEVDKIEAKANKT